MGMYQDLAVRLASSRVGGWIVLNILNPLDKRLMRWSKGRISSGVGTTFADNSVLLTCTGAKSGKRFEIPLLTARLGDRFVLIASATGQKQNPGWYYNLKANPQCRLLVPGRGDLPCVAREVDGEERERAWQAAVAQYPGYVDYEKRTARRIPVMILIPEG